MSTLAALRTAAVNLVKANISTFKEVKPHVGRFTIDDLKRLHGASPSCAIGIVNATKPRRRASGELEIVATFCAVVVTRAGARSQADDDALDLAVRLAGVLSDWVPASAVPKTNPADNIHAEGVADDEIDRSSLVVWSVIWTHLVVIGTDEVGATIEPERRLGANPTITTQHPSRGEETAGGAP